jgi:hypothetical protein
MVRPSSCPGSDGSWQGKDKEHAMSQKIDNLIAVIDVGIGNNSFHVVGLNARGHRSSAEGERGQPEARLAKSRFMQNLDGQMR